MKKCAIILVCVSILFVSCSLSDSSKYDGYDIAYLHRPNPLAENAPQNAIRLLNSSTLESVEIDVGMDNVYCPLWSSDGTKLYFTAFDSEAYRAEIYVYDLLSLKLKELPLEGDYLVYDWTLTLDGDEIVFVGNEFDVSEVHDVFIYNLQNGTTTKIYDTDEIIVDEIKVFENPDEFVLITHPDTGFDYQDYALTFINLDGEVINAFDNLELSPELTRRGRINDLVYFSEEGLFFFTHGYGENHWVDIYAYYTGEAKLIRLSSGQNNQNDGGLGISPDGSQIVFVSNRHEIGAGDIDIYLMDIDGENVRRLTFDGENICPSFRPDFSE